MNQSAGTESDSRPLEERWRELDAEIRTWWDGDLRRAHEPEIRSPEHNRVWIGEGEEASKLQLAEDYTLMFLPHAYVSSAGSEDAFPEMYYWDIYFINAGLLRHERLDLYRRHLLNHLFQIDRFGMVPNGNRTYYRTRSQTPLLAADVWRYYEHTGDHDMLMLAYPRLKREYDGYWCAQHHSTPIGLATNRDLGDPNLRPELAAEAEALDFTPIYGGDVRRCVPLQTNFALVKCTRVLADAARVLGLDEDVVHWDGETETREDLIRRFCWDDREGFYFEYDFVGRQRLPYWSLCAYWAMWCGTATEGEAEKLIRHLGRFLFDGGLAVTDRIYPSPHPEFEWLQWEYPAGWPPLHMMCIEACERYGYIKEAREIAVRFLGLMVSVHDQTGKLWEKYNVVDGGVELPRERYSVPPFHGWSSAAVVMLGPFLALPEEKKRRVPE